MTHREKMIERAARDLWDKAEHDYWDHETDCRAFDVNGIPSIDETREDGGPSRHTATRQAPAISAADFGMPDTTGDEPAVDTTTGEVIEEQA